MINAEDFFDQIAAVTKHQINDRKVRIGYIDSDFEEHLYPEIQPRVYLDGEGLTHRGYPCVSSYAPMRGDRVILLPVGENYVILGSIERADRDLLKPGQVVFQAMRTQEAHTITPGDGNAVVIGWDTFPIDLVASGFQGADNPGRFNPQVPGHYMLYGSVGFAATGAGNPRTGNYLRARWRVNGDSLLPNGSQVSSAMQGGTAACSVIAPPLTIPFNGSTDFVTLEAAHDNGFNLSTQTASLAPTMTAIYVGPLPEGSGPSQLSLE